MLLLNKYFTLDAKTVSGHGANCKVSLKKDCDVYRGHFPGNPVSPGVCNIEMIKECFNIINGCNLRIKSIDRCRLTAVASPTESPAMNVELEWSEAENGVMLTATLSDAERQYMDFKGTLE